MRISKSVSKILVLLTLFIFTKSHAQTDYEKLYAQSKEFYKTGNYAEALNCNIKALKIIEQSNDCSLKVLGHMEVGKIHYFLRNRRLALKSYFMAKSFSEACPADTMDYRIYHNIGSMFVELGKVDSALLFLNRAFDILTKARKYKPLSKVNAVLADLHLNQTHNLKQAEKHIVSAEKYANMTQDLGDLAFAKTKRAWLYRWKEDFPNAILHLKKAIIIYDQIGGIEERMYMHKVMAELMALSGNPEASIVFNRLLVMKDSIFKVQTADKIAN